MLIEKGSFFCPRESAATANIDNDQTDEIVEQIQPKELI